MHCYAPPGDIPPRPDRDGGTDVWCGCVPRNAGSGSGSGSGSEDELAIFDLDLFPVKIDD